MIGATQLSYLSFRIAGHPLTIIEADGYYTRPHVVDELEINSGQRYSVLIDTPLSRVNASNEGVFRVEVGVRWRKIGPMGLAYLVYNQSMVCISNKTLEKMAVEYPAQVADTPPSTPGWILSQLKPLRRMRVPPATRQIVIAGRQSAVNRTVDGVTQPYLRWTINGEHYEPPTQQPLLSILQKDKDSLIPDGSRSLVFDVGMPSTDSLAPIAETEVIDVVFENYVSLNGVCEQHP